MSRAAAESNRDDCPWEDLKKIAHQFGFSVFTALNKARNEEFPAPVYKLGGRWVMDKEVKAAYFAQKRAEGFAQLQKSTNG